jgi:Ser/Thr protein kinase RdoA (MazF antagonist)
MKTLDAIEPSAECKIGEGREAELFDLGEGRVLRLYRSANDEMEARRQANLLKEIAQLGIRVPRVYETITAVGRPGIVMERLDGSDLLTDVARRPWRVLQVGALCGRLHAGLNDARAPNMLPSLNDSLYRRIAESELLPSAYTDAAVKALSALRDGHSLCHGDFHPGNVMMAHEEPVVFDWSAAARGPAEADFARSDLILSLGEPPPGSPAHLKALALVGRSLLLAAYRRAYRRSRQVDEETLHRWRLPLAVARLAVGIPEEETRLTRHIDRLIGRPS